MSKLINKSIFYIIAILISLGSGTFSAMAMNCADAPNVEKKEEGSQKILNLVKSRRLISILSSQSVRRVLADEDLPSYGELLTQIIEEMAATNDFSKEAFFNQIRLRLAGKISDALIEDGITRYNKKDPESLYRLLGNLTFAETRIMYTGYAEGLEISQNSLLGQYINETGAQARLGVLKSKVPQNGPNQERILVPVSNDSFGAFLKYFSGTTGVSVFGHANGVFNGKSYSHSGGAPKQLQVLKEGTPLPWLILKPSEGERALRYFTLASSQKYLSWHHHLKLPWKLPGYIKRGLYECCTHHWGNIPIGDRLVDEYILPMRGQDSNNPKGAKLGNWDITLAPELKNIWTTPGREQLSSVIGESNKNADGEFASPGYLIQTLFGPTSNLRVPIVFIFVQDHTQKLPYGDQLKLVFENPW